MPVRGMSDKIDQFSLVPFSDCFGLDKKLFHIR